MGPSHTQANEENAKNCCCQPTRQKAGQVQKILQNYFTKKKLWNSVHTAKKNHAIRKENTIDTRREKHCWGDPEPFFRNQNWNSKQRMCSVAVLFSQSCTNVFEFFRLKLSLTASHTTSSTWCKAVHHNFEERETERVSEREDE